MSYPAALLVAFIISFTASSGCRDRGNGTADAGQDGANDLSAHDTSDATDASKDAASDAVPTPIIANEPGGPSDLALDNEYVYWTSYYPASIKRMAKAGGPPQLLATIPNFG